MASDTKFEPVIEFTKDSRYLCHSDLNGVLKFWDVATGTLKQEYVHGSQNLSSIRCTCLSWGPTNVKIAAQAIKSPKKKKRRLEEEVVIDEHYLIAVGTSDGSILLYGLEEATLHYQLSGGHSGRVTGLAWKSDGSRLYSCSDDGYIIDWDVNKSSIKHKWKSDQGQLTSLTLCHSQRHLLTAGRNIQLWDLKSRKVLQTFSGIEAEVTRIFEIPSACQPNDSRNCDDSMECDDRLEDAANDKHKSIMGSYVLSMVKGGKEISVRQISKTDPTSTDLLATFTVPDEPVQMSILTSSSNKQVVQMVIVTKKGKIAFYESVLNGRHKKPLKAKQLTTIVTQNGEKERILPIVASSFNPSDGSLCVVYEDFIVPVFETISPDQLKDKLHRTDRKINGSRVVEAGVAVHNAEIGEMTFGERLAAEEKPETSTASLAQALKNNNKKILNEILATSNCDQIMSAIKDLPADCIEPLIQELDKRVTKPNQQRCRTAKMWLRAVASVHTSKITSPTCKRILEPIVTSGVSMSTFKNIFELVGRMKNVLDTQLTQTQMNESTIIDELQLSEDENTYADNTLISEDESEEDEDDLAN